MGNIQHNVDYFRILANGESVNVGAVYAVIWGPQDLSLFNNVAFEIYNPDVSQTVDVIVEVARTGGVGTWATLQFGALMSIGPGETRSATLPKTAQQWTRLSAKSDGAGVNAAVLTVTGVQTRLVS